MKQEKQLWTIAGWIAAAITPIIKDIIQFIFNYIQS